MDSTPNSGKHSVEMHKILLMMLIASFAYTTAMSADRINDMTNEQESRAHADCMTRQTAQIELQHVREEMYLLLNTARDKAGLPPLNVPETDIISC